MQNVQRTASERTRFSDLLFILGFRSQAIHFAAQAGDCKVIQALLDRGVSLSTPNRFGKRPIDLVLPRLPAASLLGPRLGSALNDALSERQRERALELIAGGSQDLLARHPASGSLCTHLAASAGFVDVFELLIARGVPLNARNWRGEQADHCATAPAMIHAIAAARQRVQTRRADMAAWAATENADLMLPWPVTRIVLVYWNGS